MNLLAQFRNFSLLVLALCAFTACQNDEENPFTTNDAQSLEDNTEAEFIFDDALTLGIAVGNSRSGQIDSGRPSGGEFDKDGDEDTFGPCVTITFENLEEYKKITIDFGTEGCTGFDNKLRKGKVILTFTARHFVPGSVVTTTFDGYSVNGIGVEGTKTVTNITTEGGNPTHQIVVADAKLTFPDNTTIEWDSNRKRKFVQGSDTPFIVVDNVYNIEGTYSGKNRRNNTYTLTTTTDLEYKAACRIDGYHKPSAGIVEVESSNRPDYTVDFGTGTCDDTYTATVNGNVIVING
jgi:hypothetical protein